MTHPSEGKPAKPVRQPPELPLLSRTHPDAYRTANFRVLHTGPMRLGTINAILQGTWGLRDAYPTDAWTSCWVRYHVITRDQAREIFGFPEGP